MDRFFHSVTLDYDKCVGCTNCVKHCPTEAIRIREGKAVITPERCIDCGECIRVCPHHAKKAKYDKLEQMNQFEYKIALPAPSLYGQFSNLDHIDMVLTALKRIQSGRIGIGGNPQNDAERSRAPSGNQLRLPGDCSVNSGAVPRYVQPCTAPECTHGNGSLSGKRRSLRAVADSKRKDRLCVYYALPGKGNRH